ncbi:MAG TPA: hypothetical protein PKY05_18955, partial [Fibrobacteria bacterium]|nr:hypothetical protein [Fibrobacteria bacterium]
MIHILSTLRGSTEFVQAREASKHLPESDPEPICPVRPGEAAFLGQRHGLPVARAVAQPLAGHPGTGNIALFECLDDPAMALELLGACETHLAKLGCRTILGPLDGDTWHAYRTVDPGSDPPFLLDRSTPDWTGELFRRSGYRVCDRYLSTWIPREHLAWPRLEAHWQRLARRGVAIRPLDAADWDRELERLHALSLEAFADNSWASPLDFQ